MIVKAELISNLHQLVHIKIMDKKYVSKYQYIPAQPAKWYRRAKPASLYNHMYSEVPLPNENWLEQNSYTLDDKNRIWSLPRMFIWFSDGSAPLEYVFQKYEDAVVYRDKVLEECKNLKMVDLDKLMKPKS